MNSSTTLKVQSSSGLNVPIIILLVFALFMVSAHATIHAGISADAGMALLDLFQFLQAFLTTSVTLGLTVAVLVNLFKPWIPDGYADTAAFLTTILVMIGVGIAKLISPAISLGGLEAFFQSLVDKSPLWLPILAWLIHFISGQAHALLAGIPLIGRSNSKPSIFSRAARNYNQIE